MMVLVKTKSVKRGRKGMRILIADDQQRVRSAVRLLLEQQPEPDIVEEVTGTDELIKYVGNGCPDILLVEWDLPDLIPEKIFAKLRITNPEIVIIVLNTRPQTEHLAILAGANAFVSKNDPPERLIAVINSYRYVDVRK